MTQVRKYRPDKGDKGDADGEQAPVTVDPGDTTAVRAALKAAADSEQVQSHVPQAARKRG
jgi:hypothetical protein